MQFLGFVKQRWVLGNKIKNATSSTCSLVSEDDQKHCDIW